MPQSAATDGRGTPPPAPLCAVCLCDVAPAQRCVLLQCAHVFCIGCIEAWAARGARACPLCRAHFSGWRHAFGCDDDNEDSFRTHLLLPLAAEDAAAAPALLAAARADAGAQVRAVCALEWRSCVGVC